MLQTKNFLQKFSKNFLFQVPKGMLQTPQSIISLFSPYGPFQVPKGMLQTAVSCFEITRVTVFQVPKGMLQTPPHSPD